MYSNYLLEYMRVVENNTLNNKEASCLGGAAKAERQKKTGSTYVKVGIRIWIGYLRCMR